MIFFCPIFMRLPTGISWKISGWNANIATGFINQVSFNSLLKVNYVTEQYMPSLSEYVIWQTHKRLLFACQWLLETADCMIIYQVCECNNFEHFWLHDFHHIAMVVTVKHLSFRTADYDEPRTVQFQWHKHFNLSENWAILHIYDQMLTHTRQL